LYDNQSKLSSSNLRSMVKMMHIIRRALHVLFNLRILYLISIENLLDWFFTSAFAPGW
jgi:hypothetical protein